MQEGEQAEDSALQQIAQIATQVQQQPTPDGYAQILQIVQGLLQHNEGEEKEMGAEGGDSHAKMLQAVKNEMGGGSQE